MSLRVVFMGTPELACASLEQLLAEPRLELLAVVTQPDRPKGRDLKLSPSPVKQVALRRGLKVMQPERARNPDFVDSLQQMQPDLVVVAAYGQILPASLLAAPRFGCLNVHTSLLPRHRGAAPIQWSILAGDAVTGVTIMQMDAGLDTGAILSQAETPISEQDDAQSLHDRLARMGAQLLLQTIPQYVEGRIVPHPQPPEGVTYARRIKREDGRIDWTRPARQIWNQVRALVPWPATFTHLPEPSGALLKIWRAEMADLPGTPGVILQADHTGLLVGCGHQSLRLLSLQREGARRLGPREFLAGCPLQPGQKLDPRVRTVS